MTRVPVRALRNGTAQVLQRVKSGEVVEVTEYGRPVARLIPLGLDRWEQLEALGLIEPRTAEGDVLDEEPLPPTPGVPLPSDVLARLRSEER